MDELFTIRIPNQQLEEETIQLCFGKRIGSFLLDRILSRHDEERLLQFEPRPADRDRSFLHGFEQGGLGLRGGSIDLVRQADLRENRPPLKLKDSPAFRRLHDHVGAQNVGRHQIGSELDAIELADPAFAPSVRHQQRFAESGDALEQTVPTNKQASQNAMHNLFVADNDSANLFL